MDETRWWCVSHRVAGGRKKWGGGAGDRERRRGCVMIAGHGGGSSEAYMKTRWSEMVNTNGGAGRGFHGEGGSSSELAVFRRGWWRFPVKHRRRCWFRVVGRRRGWRLGGRQARQGWL
jgi:hypothetical protein